MERPDAGSVVVGQDSEGQDLAGRDDQGSVHRQALRGDLVQRVEARRLEEGLSVRALADIVGITFSALAKIIRGEHHPSNTVQLRLEAWLKFGADMPSWRKKMEWRLAEVERQQKKILEHQESMAVDRILPGVTVEGSTSEENSMAKKKTSKRKAKKAVASKKASTRKRTKGAKKPKPAPKKPKPPKAY